MNPSLFIGTSGWWYSHWHGRYYPTFLPVKKRLPFISKRLNAIEVNSTFYSAPMPGVVNGWYRNTPSHFSFVLKAPKIISHTMKDSVLPLKTHIVKIKDVASVLKNKYKGLLIQFPPSCTTDFDGIMHVQEVIALCSEFSILKPLFLEFRHDSWFKDDGFMILDLKLIHENINIVSAYHSTGKWFYPPIDTNVYLRFHGTEKFSVGSYPSSKMEQILSSLPDDVENVYGFFNNDYEASAPIDAERFTTIAYNKENWKLNG